MSRFSKATLVRPIGAALMLGVALAGCSDIYYDRRETLTFGGNDAVATNLAVQTVDPWPKAAANRDHPTNGAIAATAIQRYRTGRVIPPRGTGSSSAGYSAPQTPPPDAAAMVPPPTK
jgi:hypothetical protein